MTDKVTEEVKTEENYAEDQLDIAISSLLENFACLDVLEATLKKLINKED